MCLKLIIIINSSTWKRHLTNYPTNRSKKIKKFLAKTIIFSCQITKLLSGKFFKNTTLKNNEDKKTPHKISAHCIFHNEKDMFLGLESSEQVNQKGMFAWTKMKLIKWINIIENLAISRIRFSTIKDSTSSLAKISPFFNILSA